MAAIAAMVFGVGMIDTMDPTTMVLGALITFMGIVTIVMYAIILTIIYEDE
jgi:hypothetical protein